MVVILFFYTRFIFRLESRQEFTLTNPQNTKTHVVFDFQTDEFFVEDEEGKSGSFEIPPKTSRKFLLGFRPISVTFFDFKLPILMNEVIVKSFIKFFYVYLKFLIR